MTLLDSKITFRDTGLTASGDSTQGVTIEKPELTNVQQGLTRGELLYRQPSLITSPGVAKEATNENERPSVSTGELKSVSHDDDPSQPVNPFRTAILTTSTPTSVRTVLPTNIQAEEVYIPGNSTTESQTGMSAVKAFPYSPKYIGARKCYY